MGEPRPGLDAVDGGGRLVIAVDQFEEAFTACRDDASARSSSAELVAAPRDPRGSAVILLTIRADPTGAARATRSCQTCSPPTTCWSAAQRDELRDAVVRPALARRPAGQPGLADTLVNDVEGEPGALPLLSSALLELWRGREGRRLRLAGYEGTGGVRGAVARLAEGAFGRLDAAQQEVARRRWCGSPPRGPAARSSGAGSRWSSSTRKGGQPSPM